MATIISPNMGLPVPVVGQEPGPQYAQDVNNSLDIVDAHDHSPGSGVLITPDGLNINADLPIQNNSLTQILATLFTPQATTLASSITSAVYTVVNSSFGSDLYFNTGNGTPVAVVLNGVVAGTPGSIAGLVSPASATYTPLSATFTWSSAPNTPALMNQGPTTIANNTAGAAGVTIVPNSSITVPWQLTLPTAPPASTKIVQMDSTGNLLPNLAVDGTTILNSGTVLSIGTVPPASAPLAVFVENTSSVNESIAGSLSPIVMATLSFTASGRYPVRICVPEAVINGSLSGASANYVVAVELTLSGSVSGTIGSRLMGEFITGGIGGWTFVTGRTMDWVFTPGAGTETYSLTAQATVTVNTSSSGPATATFTLVEGFYAHEVH